MKTPLLLAAILAVALPNPTIHAQSSDELAIRQARAARDKSAADAMEPINRRYLETLNALFKKATPTANLKLAKAIQAEIQAVGGTAAVAAASGTKLAPAAVSATGATLNRTELKKLIENTRWEKTGPGIPGYLLLYRNGVTKQKGVGPGMVDARWEVEAPDVLKFEGRVPKAKTGEKPALPIFRIDVSAMTATFDESKSTGGADWSLKYKGPAPKK